ncbi:MAG: hypothetical protein IJM72_04650, partial [Deltaproteobacteria bacterium]|nr:hypothetical protein [Deltaproteobacteria bacterium]
SPNGQVQASVEKTVVSTVAHQEKPVTQATPPSPNAQVQASAEKPAVSTMAHQEKTVMQATPSPNGQVQASVEKPVVSTVAHQEKPVMQAALSPNGQVQASVEKPVVSTVAHQEKPVMQATPSSSNGQVQASAEKPVVSTVAHQEKPVMQAAPSPNGQVQASAEKPVVSTVAHQEKPVMQVAPSPNGQVQTSAEKPVVSTVTPQEKTVTQAASSPNGQVQASAEKPVVSTVAHQEKPVMQAAPSPNGQMQAFAEKPVVNTVSQQGKAAVQNDLPPQGRTESGVSASDPQLRNASGKRTEPTFVQTRAQEASPTSVSSRGSGIAQTVEPQRSENAGITQNVVQNIPFSNVSRTNQKGLKLDDERLMQALGVGEKRKTTKEVSSLPPMNGPLDGLPGVQTMSRAEASSEVEPANPNLHIDNEMVQKCVERILVSRPEDGTSEVRIQIGRDILPDTEIRLNRGVDGQLNIHMYTGNESSFQSMVAMRNDLLNNLEHQENNSVRVEISFQNDAENGDMNRRSRGYVQQDDSLQN